MQKQLLALAVVAVALLSVSFLLTPQNEKEAKTELQQLADLINSNPQLTWKAESKPKELDIEYRNRMFNLIIDDPPADFDQQPKTSLAAEDLPENFDSRVNWPKCESIKEIRDQSSCGGCYAVAAASAMSDRICIASNQTDQRRISSEDIL